MAALIAEGRSELDPDARQTVYEQALQIGYDEALFVWLVNNEDIYGLSENLSWTPRVDAKLLVVEMNVVE
jgi:peptide/nickel transport system substrate-binding protein